MHGKELAVQVRDFFDLLYKTEEDSSGERFYLQFLEDYDRLLLLSMKQELY